MSDVPGRRDFVRYTYGHPPQSLPVEWSDRLITFLFAARRPSPGKGDRHDRQ